MLALDGPVCYQRIMLGRGCTRMHADREGLMRSMMPHPRLWLVVCAWCLICWTASAQASWEAYQRAGEAAYSHGHYAEAGRMLLAAVREARYFGPQDPRLDISLNTLALLRVTRDQHGNAPRRSEPTARRTETARQGRVSQRGRQRQQPRTALQRAKPGRHQQDLLSRRSGWRRKSPRISTARSERQAKRPRAALHRVQSNHRTVPAVRREKRQKSVRRESSRRAPHLRRDQQLQRPRVTIRRAGPKHPGRRARPGIKRQAARSPRRAMLPAGQPRIAQLWLQQRTMA